MCCAGRGRGGARDEHARNGDLAARLVELLAPLARQHGLVPTTAFNLGAPDDFRVPDLGVHRQRPTDLHCASAAAVVEVRSPRDETFAKLPFYARRGVQEVWVVEPLERTVRLWSLAGGRYDEVTASGLLGTTAADVAAELDWPTA